MSSTEQQPLASPKKSSGSNNDLEYVFDLIEKTQWQKLLECIKNDQSIAFAQMSRGGSAMLALGSQGNYVLHEVCKCDPPVEIVAALIEANPAATREKGQWGYLPLHYACTSGASKEVVSKLIAANPGAARVRDDNDGTIPLHLATKWGASEEVLMEILIAYPEGTLVRDAESMTPMDHAHHAIKLRGEGAGSNAIRVLGRGPAFCTVSKSAMARAKQEYDWKLRGIQDAHSAHVGKIEAQYDSDIARLHAKLRIVERELTDAKDKNNDSSDALKKVELDLNEVSREKAMTLDLLEEERNEFQSAVEQKNQKIVELVTKLESSKEVEEELVKKIQDLENIKADLENEVKVGRAHCEKLRMETILQQHRLVEAARKRDLYNARMTKVEEWISSLAHTMHAWTIDAELNPVDEQIMAEKSAVTNAGRCGSCDTADTHSSSSASDNEADVRDE